MFIINNLKQIIADFHYFSNGIVDDVTSFKFIRRFNKNITKLNNLRKFIFKKYIYTINHKRIAINYLFFAAWTGLSGAALATMIRFELSYPGSTFFKGDSLRYLQVITVHALIMIFFFVVPVLFGTFANFLIPYHVGSKDVAFPRLNSIGFWIQPCGYLLLAKMAFLRPQFWRYYDKPSFYAPLQDKLNANSRIQLNSEKEYFFAFLNRMKLQDGSVAYANRKKITQFKYEFFNFIPLKLFFWPSLINYSESFWFAANRVTKMRRNKVYFTKCSNRTLTLSGWAFITPFSSNTKFTGVGAQDIAILGVIFAGISSTISFTNLLITRRTLGMPGLRNRRILLPFITIALLLAMRMLALVTPVLAAAMLMLILDRHWQTTFFDFMYGGDTILFQHLFWFFGHPEVYILIIPTFGIVNMTLPYANTRRIASKHHLIWAIYMMAYMGFIVWGHHMYLVGLDHRSRALYSTITVMISLPATVKVVNWTLTLLNGALKWDVTLAFSLAYILLFLSGGLTGMWLSHVGLNVSMHDSFYVIAHFHLMLSGATVTACFTGLYYYFTAFFGIKYSRVFGYLHLIYYFGGQWLTFIPLFWVGYAGMPRRIHDYPNIFLGWQGMASVGHFVTLVGVFFFFCMLVDSHIERRVAVYSTLGIPRWHKRINYYVFKIRYLLYTKKQLTGVPSSAVRNYLRAPYFNEYECYKK
jgi:heme/copper-type cytochrome/quinol oxidase subunit 1